MRSDIVGQVVHRSGEGPAKPLAEVVRIAPDIQRSERQYLIKARSVGKVLHTKARGSDVLAIACRNLDRFAHDFSIEFFTGQRSWSLAFSILLFRKHGRNEQNK